MSDYMTMALNELAAEITADGVVDAEEVKKMKERLYADNVIDREEADFLFTINDAVSGANNDPSWKELFVEALTTHVLKDETSPDVLDDGEASYLVEKIQGDKKVDANELALLVNIAASAKSTPENFQKFVLASLKDVILEDGVIDENEVAMIRKVVYGIGSGSGASVDRAEADFIFDLNDATTGKANHSSWKELFVEALSKHVLEDETSPGVIDESEGDWLISRVESDNEYDENEKALFVNIKTNAKSMTGKLKFKMDLFQI